MVNTKILGTVALVAVLLSSAGIGGATTELRSEPVPITGCDMTFPGDTCTGGTHIYAGAIPTLTADLLATGTFKATLYEDWGQPNWYSITSTCVFDIVTGPTCTISYGIYGAPWYGYRVQLIAESVDGYGLPAVHAGP
jgi:hypothetical protein